MERKQKKNKERKRSKEENGLKEIERILKRKEKDKRRRNIVIRVEVKEREAVEKILRMVGAKFEKMRRKKEKEKGE